MGQGPLGAQENIHSFLYFSLETEMDLYSNGAQKKIYISQPPQTRGDHVTNSVQWYIGRSFGQGFQKSFSQEESPTGLVSEGSRPATKQEMKCKVSKLERRSKMLAT